jgi:DNA-binding beta-propeller fold protein YncE
VKPIIDPINGKGTQIQLKRDIRWGLKTMCAAVCALSLTSASALAAKQYVPGGSFGEPGAAAGQLEGPEGVAVNDNTGNVYVADTGNMRIDEFEADGAFVEAWGWEVGGVPGVGKCTTLIPCQKGASGAGPGEFETVSGIAVDNSTGASKEDVYTSDVGDALVEKFTAVGEFLSVLTGTCEKAGEAAPCSGSKEIPFGELHGITVDRHGDLWVYEGQGNVDEFDDTGTFLKTFSTGRGSQSGVAIDSREEVFVTCCSRQVGKWDGQTGTAIREEFSGEETTALAIDSATDDLLVDKESRFDVYGQFGEPLSAPIERFPVSPEPALTESHGVALDRPTGTVYAGERGADKIAIFNDVSFPDIEPPIVTESLVTLRGSIDPEGTTIVACNFEYGLSEAEPGHYEHTTPCVPPHPSGNNAVPVSAEVIGLQSHQTVHYRLIVNNGTDKSIPDSTFFTSTRPTVEEESVSRIGSTEATVSAQVDAADLPTTYRVEYGTSASYGSSTTEASLGAPESATEVLVRLSGLQAGTEYHFHVVAKNTFGEGPGQDATFVTPASGASALVLPDNRAYELVSGLGNAGDVYVPGAQPIERPKEDTPTEYPFRSSLDGNALVYAGYPGASGGNGATGENLGNEFFATRDPSQGWHTSDITPEVAEPGKEETGNGYEFFSSDLTFGVLSTGVSSQFATRATPEGPTECEGLYSRTDTGFHALFNVRFSQPPSPIACGNDRGTGGEAKAQTLQFTGASADFSQELFQTPAALAPEAQEVPEGGEGNNLYDSTSGRLSLVNVLPGESPPEAVYGGPPGNVEIPGDFSNVISEDGSRIFWTDMVTHRIYMRENADSSDARTVPVSGGAGSAQYWTATPDGAHVYYTENGELWRFDTRDETREALARTGLKGENTEVQGVIGTSDDGSYVYFVAGGALSSEPNSRGEVATQRACEEAEGSELLGHLPPGKGCNLYVLHTGQGVSYIAALAAKDDRLYPRQGFKSVVGDWRPNLGARTAEVTADGRHLVFESTQQLTSYDNHLLDERELAYGAEIFVYAADGSGTGRLFCASCDPVGAPPAREEATGEHAGAGTYLPASVNPAFMRRWISQDGGRVFFDTSQPLVPQDQNGAQDVYEWEREGEGTCTVRALPRPDGGCVSLLSGGDSGDYSYLLDADAQGNTVFFTHRGQLGQTGAAGTRTAVYDARVSGGFQRTSLACTGTGCQGVPPAPPSFATPSSVTFDGAGNFPALAQAIKPKPKSLTLAQRLAKALKACKKVHKRKKAEDACERQARQRYRNEAKSKPRRLAKSTTGGGK